MQKRMDEVKVGDVVLVKGARLPVESIAVGNPFIELRIANMGQVIFGRADWMVEAVEWTTPAGEVKVGDIVEVVEGEKILVRSVRQVGSFVQFTAFGHPGSDRWYVHPAVALKHFPMTFEVEQSNWEYVKSFVQLPLPFPQGVL